MAVGASSCHSSRALRLLLLASLPLASGLRRAAQGGGDFEQQAVPSSAPRYRIAVLTAGTLVRYFLEPTAENLVAPLVREGHTVDYFASLNSEPFRAWKGYARTFLIDPAFQGRGGNLTFVADLINQTIRKAGGSVRKLQLLRELKLSENAARDFIMNATGWNMQRDPKRTFSARINVLKLLLQFEQLWAQVLKAEQTDGAYDFVMMTRDDALWVRPFSLSAVLQAPNDMRFFNDSVKPLAFHSLPGPVQGFHQRCVEGSGSYYDAQYENGLTEYILILKRGAAAPFFTLYSRLVGNPKYWPALNLEQLLPIVAGEERIPLKPMPAALVPMQRAGRVWLHHLNRSITCLHKPCDSATASVPPLRPMDTHSGSPICWGISAHLQPYWKLPPELFAHSLD